MVLKEKICIVIYSNLNEFGAASPFQDRLDIKKGDSVELYAVVPEKGHAGVSRLYN